MYVAPPLASHGKTLRRETLPGQPTGNPVVVGSYTACQGTVARSATVSPGFVGGVRKAGAYWCYANRIDTTPMGWSREVTGTGKVIEYWGGWGSNPNLSSVCNVSYGPLQPIFSYLRVEAATKARAKLGRGSVDLGVAIGESRSTLSTLINGVSRLGRIVAAVRRRSLSPLGEGSAQAYWLEMQYGWKPLLSDIFGAYELLQKGLADKDQVISVSQTARESYTYTNSSVTMPMKLSVTVNLTAKVSDPTIASLRSLGLINPALIAWNMMKWSFVIDWFLPIGTFLEALTGTAGLTFLTGSYTRHVEVDHSYTYEYKPNSSASPATTRHVLKGVSMQRTVYAGFPFALLYMDRNPLRSTRSVSAVALALQQMSKR